ncbi:hypothetical protein [Bradyrhizobium sp. BWA-3-5]|nr:hypothetical protein [Bradyrhizobium sp. BWA-3-5]WOH63996.1 hypothetical protein RX331_25650 [Bradyrhizobium sp. BWA-3-5]
MFGSIFQRLPALRLSVAPEELKLRKEIITGQGDHHWRVRGVSVLS